MKSYYDHLGVSPQANSDDIRKAYKELSRKYHPDKHPKPQDKQKATQIFNSINEAYNALSDSTKRMIYDRWLTTQHNLEKMIAEQNESLRNTQRYRIPHLESLRKLDSNEDHIRTQLVRLQSEFENNYEELKTKLAEIDKKSLQQINPEEMVRAEQKTSDHTATPREERPSQNASHNTGSNKRKTDDNKTSTEQDIPLRPTTPARESRENKARFATRINFKGETELHVAIKLKDIKRLMSLELDVYEWIRTNYKQQNFVHYIAKYINFQFLNINEQDYIFNIISKNNKLINDQDKNGNTPLHMALKYFNWKLAIFLLKTGSNVNVINKNKKNVLHVMLEDVLSEQITVKQCFDVALKLISDVNAKDILGNTALHYAIANNNNYAVIELLMHGADINAQNEEGDTPLHYAARYGNEYAAGELLKRRAQIVVNKREEVPLHNAIMTLNDIRSDNIQTQQNIISYLLKAFARQVRCVDHNKHSPLHYAVNSDVLNLEIINLLLKHDAPVNLQDKEGNSPFHILLTRDKCIDLFAAFIAKGADIYLTNKKNKSPLLLLIEDDGLGEISTLSKLLDMKTAIKIDLNKIYADGKSILYSALLWSDHPLAKLLMDKGALLNKSDGTPDEILTNLRNKASSKEIIDLAEQAIKLSFVSKLPEKVTQKRQKSSEEKSSSSKRERKESSNAIVNPAVVSSTMFNETLPSVVNMQQMPDCDTADSLKKSGRR